MTSRESVLGAGTLCCCCCSNNLGGQNALQQHQLGTSESPEQIRLILPTLCLWHPFPSGTHSPPSCSRVWPRVQALLVMPLLSLL